MCIILLSLCLTQGLASAPEKATAREERRDPPALLPESQPEKVRKQRGI